MVFASVKDAFKAVPAAVGGAALPVAVTRCFRASQDANTTCVAVNVKGVNLDQGTKYQIVLPAGTR